MKRFWQLRESFRAVISYTVLLLFICGINCRSFNLWCPHLLGPALGYLIITLVISVGNEEVRLHATCNSCYCLEQLVKHTIIMVNKFLMQTLILNKKTRMLVS